MVAACRDGADVLFAGRAGTGPFGTLVTAALHREGIEVLHDPVPDVDSGYCVALVDDTAERTFVTHVGAEGTLSRTDLDRTPLREGDTVFVSGYGLAHPANAAALAAWLPDVPAAHRVVLDVSPLVDVLDADVLATALRRSDVVTTNRREAHLLVPGASPAAAAEHLATAHDLAAVVRDGGDGCWVARPGATAVHVPGFAVQAVDTNGAGDAHDGVLMTSLARGLPVEAAARRANAAAALSVTRSGPATAPTAVEIDALADSRQCWST